VELTFGMLNGPVMHQYMPPGYMQPNMHQCTDRNLVLTRKPGAVVCQTSFYCHWKQNNGPAAFHVQL
jgi:hypothetical protein